MHSLKVIIADGWVMRAAGLLFRPKLRHREMLWIRSCRAVHSFGMRYPITLYFLDARHKVILVVPNFKPFRLSWCQDAESVVETLFSDQLNASEIEQAIKLALSRTRVRGL